MVSGPVRGIALSAGVFFHFDLVVSSAHVALGALARSRTYQMALVGMAELHARRGIQSRPAQDPFRAEATVIAFPPGMTKFIWNWREGRIRRRLCV
jgi:hypothetical protein